MRGARRGSRECRRRRRGIGRRGFRGVRPGDERNCHEHEEYDRGAQVPGTQERRGGAAVGGWGRNGVSSASNLPLTVRTPEPVRSRRCLAGPLRAPPVSAPVALAELRGLCPERLPAAGGARPSQATKRGPCRYMPVRGLRHGASRARTGDLLLAKQALFQLSYGPSAAILERTRRVLKRPARSPMRREGCLG